MGPFLIFINYRRHDTEGITGRLFGHLEHHFSPDELLIDIEDIPAGFDVVRRIEAAVRRCNVVVVMIGPDWLYGRDRQGRRLIDRDNDHVRIQIEAALRFDKLLIPVLVDGAEMPVGEDLPASMRVLARLSPIRLSRRQFRANVHLLVQVLRGAVDHSAETERMRISEPPSLAFSEGPTLMDVPPTSLMRAPRPAAPSAQLEALPRTELENPPLVLDGAATVIAAPAPPSPPTSKPKKKKEANRRVSASEALLVVGDDTLVDVVQRRLGSRLIRRLAEEESGGS